MNKAAMKFWVTCPNCKRKFGVSPEIIMKYFDRFIGALEANINRRAKEFGVPVNEDSEENASKNT